VSDLTTIPNQLDEKSGQCCAIIETPKGCRNKFAYDPESNLFKLAGLLPEGMMFPFDFGFIPSTLGDDGDPLDIMVLMDAPAHGACLMDGADRRHRSDANPGRENREQRSTAWRGRPFIRARGPEGY